MNPAPYDMWAHALTVAHGGLVGAKIGLKTTFLARSFKQFIRHLTSGAQKALDAPQPEKIKRLGRVAREISEYKRGESEPPTDADMKQALQDAGYQKTQRPKTRAVRMQALRDKQDRFALMPKPKGPSLWSDESDRETPKPYPFVSDINRRSSRAAASSSSSAAPPAASATLSADQLLEAMLKSPQTADAIYAMHQKAEEEREQRRPTRRHRTKKPVSPERGSGLPMIPEHVRGLIHVPDPVLPHNDVGNDPYLIKSQHNNIIE